MMDWETFFKGELQKESFRDLLRYIDEAYDRGSMVFPPRDAVFRAFKETPLERVRVVLLGQDPYHEEGQAQGLSFSVPNGMKLPPSLRNMFKELKDDIGVERDSSSADLAGWARQGVLMLNVYLTVEKGKALSHADSRYIAFAKDVFTCLEALEQPIVYLLWGKFAQSFSRFVTRENHWVLPCAHPSPLSANRGGFFGAKPYSKTNDFLVRHGESPIDWSK